MICIINSWKINTSTKISIYKFNKKYLHISSNTNETKKENTSGFSGMNPRIPRDINLFIKTLKNRLKRLKINRLRVAGNSLNRGRSVWIYAHAVFQPRILIGSVVSDAISISVLFGAENKTASFRRRALDFRVMFRSRVFDVNGFYFGINCFFAFIFIKLTYKQYKWIVAEIFFEFYVNGFI